MKNVSIILSVCGLISILAPGCKESSNTLDPISHDIVTTVTITLKSNGEPVDTIVAVWEDIDGVGGTNPNQIDTLILSAGTVYTGSVKVENRSLTPTVDLTPDIAKEPDNHQFFYAITNSLGKVTVTDMDSRQLPLGLSFSLSSIATASATFGTLTMSLSHWENSSDKDGTKPSAETDVSIILPMTVR